MNIYEIETILENNKINSNEFGSIKSDPEFSRLLDSEVRAWNSASNTLERTKLKAGAMIEEFLPEANKRIHDGGENLPAKTELVKVLAKIAGMSDRDVTGAGNGENFSVTINLGADQKLHFDKSSRTIEGEVLQESK